MGGGESKEFNKEELLESQKEIEQVVNSVEENILKVEQICKIMDQENLEEIEEEDDQEDDDILKGIEITPEVEEVLKVKSKDYGTLITREELLNKKVFELEKLCANFPKDSVCHGLADLLSLTTKNKLKSNTEFKKYMILKSQESPK